MAEVHFRPDVEIMFADAVWHHVKRLECSIIPDVECNCECHFVHSKQAENKIICLCRKKGNTERFYS